MPYVRHEVNLMDYLHERAQESRHKETQACLMFLAGGIFFVGGILETLLPRVNATLDWFLFIPYYTEPVGGAVLGLSLVLSGLSLMVLGVISGLSYRTRRKRYIKQLHDRSSQEWASLRKKRGRKYTRRKRHKEK